MDCLPGLLKKYGYVMTDVIEESQYDENWIYTVTFLDHIVTVQSPKKHDARHAAYSKLYSRLRAGTIPKKSQSKSKSESKSPRSLEDIYQMLRCMDSNTRTRLNGRLVIEY